MMRRIAAGAAALALAASLAACGSSTSGNRDGPSQPAGSAAAASRSGAGAAPGAAKAVTVEVKGFSFSPGDVTVLKGGTVTWKFADNTRHNVTASNDKFKSKDIQAGTYAYTFNSAGAYDYICSIHQYMKGTVTVQ